MFEQEGPGWRLARDTSRMPFPVLIGGESWAIELTENEWKTLFSLVEELADQHLALVNQLMPEEAVSLEIEREFWWACLDGDKQAWSLKLILQGNGEGFRGVEAFWPIPAAQSIATAMRNLWDSCQ